MNNGVGKRIPEPWTAEDWSRAKELLATGLGYDDIAVRLRRTTRAVKAKFQKESLTPEQRARRAEYQRRKRAETTASRTVAGVTFVRVPRETAAMDNALNDRNVRINLAPRSLTAAFFGDPLPGYSALDQRRQA